MNYSVNKDLSNMISWQDEYKSKLKWAREYMTHMMCFRQCP